MRRILFALPFLIPFVAHAQQAANPVEPFRYGMHVGTAKNPLYAALSSVVPTAQADAGQAAAPVELFQYGHRIGTQSNPLYINIGHALDGYIPQSNGTFAGTLTGQNNANILASGGTVHAGYLIADATANATAFGTGWGGWYSLTSQSGAYNLSVKLDNDGNLVLSSPQLGAGGVVMGHVSYANLPQTEVSVGTLLICTDCYSSSRASGNTNTGIPVMWNGSNWVDSIGNPVEHP